MKKILFILIPLIILSCIAEVKYPSVDRVTISPETVNNLQPGQTQQFTATVHGENNPPQTVTWRMTGNTSTSTTINQSGMLTVANNETATTINITAASTYDDSKTAKAEALFTPTVISVVINPTSVNISQGGTQDFTATVNGTNNPPQTVNWSVTGNNHTGTSINDNGRLTVASSETSTSLFVQAISTFNTNINGTANATVLVPTVTSVVVSPSNPNVSPGGTQDFTATVNGTNNPPQSVNWSVTGNNHTGTSINDNGRLTVASSETSSSLVVRATSTFNTNVSGTANTTVLVPTVTSVVVSPSNPNVSPGGTQDFTATVNGTNNPPQTVNWSVTGNSSSSTTINTSGRLTVASNESSSSLVVRATSTFNTNISGTANATVLVPTVTSVVVSPSNPNVSPGGTQDFTATVTGTNNPPQTVNWSVTGNSSSSTSINSSGRLTVASNESSSSLVVRATSTFNTNINGTANATVLVPTVTSVVVSPSTTNVSPGGTRDFTATVNGTNNPPQTVNWSVTGNSSSSTSINSSGRLTVANNESSSLLVVRATSTFNTSVIGTANANVTLQVGDIITFGSYQWRVLDIQNNRALIISVNIIEQRQYHTSYTSITWENCSLRAYLNGNFYNSFTATDRARIHQVTIQNPNNPTYGTNGGNPTLDHIFLLSIAEAQQYFANNADRVATFNGSAFWWWLRSPGIISSGASRVGDGGNVGVDGFSVNSNYGGVRPALWLNF